MKKWNLSVFQCAFDAVLSENSCLKQISTSFIFWCMFRWIYIKMELKLVNFDKIWMKINSKGVVGWNGMQNEAKAEEDGPKQDCQKPAKRPILKYFFYQFVDFNYVSIWVWIVSDREHELLDFFYSIVRRSVDVWIFIFLLVNNLTYI